MKAKSTSVKHTIHPSTGTLTVQPGNTLIVAVLDPHSSITYTVESAKQNSTIVDGLGSRWTLVECETED